MSTTKENFSTIMQKIVKSELSRNQQTNFEIEGTEIIEKLFENKSEYQSERDNQFNNGHFGFLSCEIVKTGVDFLSLIVSCFNLYLAYSKAKAEKVDRRKR